MRATAMVMALAMALAAPAADGQPATAPAGEPLKVTVVSVSGPAQKLLAADGKEQWQPLKAGEQLDEMTVIRTGLGAAVVLRFADRGEVAINNAAKMGIGEFRKDGQTARTQLSLKYGTIRAKVDRTQGPADFRVTTPVAVASVRGSIGRVGFSGDMGMGISGSEGRWNVRSGAGSRNVLPGESTNDRLVPPIDLVVQFRETLLGDVHGGLGSGELRNLLLNGGGRGVFGFTGAGQDGPLPNILPPRPRDHDWEY